MTRAIRVATGGEGAHRPMFLAKDWLSPMLWPCSRNSRGGRASRSQSPVAKPWYLRAPAHRGLKLATTQGIRTMNSAFRMQTVARLA